MNISEAAYGTSVFWSTITIGRMSAICLTMFMSNKAMLLMNTTGCIFSSILMLFLSHSKSIVYLGGSLFGFFMSSIFPLAISQPTYFKMKINNSIMSTFVIFGSLGEMFVPWLIGKLIDWFGPFSLIVSSLVISILLFLNFMFTLFAAEKYKPSDLNQKELDNLKIPIINSGTPMIELEYTPIRQGSEKKRKSYEG